MGTRSAPNIDNLYTGVREKIILAHQNKHTDRLYKQKWVHFMDDIFIFFQGTKQQLTEAIRWINALFPSVKFTASFNFQTRSVEFLDVKVMVDNSGKISIDLYKKR